MESLKASYGIVRISAQTSRILHYARGRSELCIQTIIGAAAMLAESGKSATTLRENVTSPNGTTAAALNRFSQGHLSELVAGAMTAARDRSQELA